MWTVRLSVVCPRRFLVHTVTSTLTEEELPIGSPGWGVIGSLNGIVEFREEWVWLGVDGDEVGKGSTSTQPHPSVGIMHSLDECGLQLWQEWLKHHASLWGRDGMGYSSPGKQSVTFLYLPISCIIFNLFKLE